MNAPERIKPKTIRLAILLALADGAITTIDDLQTKTDETRKKVAGAVYTAATEGLIKRMRDDVTGGGGASTGIDADGRRVELTKTAQVRMCGNSVSPPVAAAIVRANLEELAIRRSA